MIIFCPKCGQKCEIEDQYAGAAVACPTCNEEFLAEPPRIVARAVPTDAVKEKKIDRENYCCLAAFFGILGIHNFYAGQIPAGSAKCFILIIWALVSILGGFLPGYVLLALLIMWVVIDLYIPPWSEKKDQYKTWLWGLFIFFWFLFGAVFTIYECILYGK